MLSSINGRNRTINGSFFTTNDIGRVFAWREVALVHRSRNGIYQRKGKLFSLLTDFGKINSCYPDFEGDSPDTIFYHGAGRRGDQKMDVFNRAMHDAIRDRIVVPLFCKLGVNRWEFMGFWRVVEADFIFEEKHQRHVWNFTLRRETGESDLMQ